ncbi:lipid A deacylase LpxR family protein [Polaribacter aestuariivivens]|uniref:Lipid A deacylase LpxR family protein n=1 Tax=Polaribacter aestuariivivens TaxID=2304626 RepID=A0A5S3N0N8_9FLAO|nr:lipid A deacylase LpxR family protein [Polaribacter aestuariivivens]TMM28760.1 lipid A deacylase LpxR family protein [Polaribacter aestuariivivens]
MKKNILFIFLFTALNLLSQEKFSKEISFITENDLYTSLKNDRYYTNGMFLSFRYLSKKKKENLEKRILEWSIGHEMYTPYKAIVLSVNDHDRPFSGYLYGSFGFENVYKNNKNLKITGQLGVIGSNAYAKELQDFIHDIYGFRKAIGWQYQIKNALALNFGVTYNKQLLKTSSKAFDVSWINNANAGTVYTNITTGFMARIGFEPLQNIANSIAFKTNINDENTRFFREIESFIFIKPSVRYAVYDATLQGSFLNKNSEVTNELVPIVFDLEIGFKFTSNRFSWGYTFNYNTNKSKGLRFDNGQKYGSINVSYLLR